MSPHLELRVLRAAANPSSTTRRGRRRPPHAGAANDPPRGRQLGPGDVGRDPKQKLVCEPY